MTIEMIELFEDKYPDIQVEPEYTAWDNYWERLTTQAAGSNLPDIVQMDNSKLNEYISRNLVKDLTPFIEEGSIDLTHVNDAYQDMNTIDDAVYAISLGSNALGMIYNQQLFDEHGVQLEEGYTYEDLKDKMRTSVKLWEMSFMGTISFRSLRCFLFSLDRMVRLFLMKMVMG